MSFAKRKADEMQVSLAGSGEVKSEEESAVTKVQIQEMADAGRHEQGGSGTQVMHMAVAQDSGLPLAGLNVMKMKGDGGCRYGTIHVLTTTKYIKDSSVGTDDGYVEDKGIGIGDTLLGCSTQDQAAQTDQVVILGDSQDVELWMEFKRKKMKNTVKIYTEGAGEVGEMVVDQKSNSGTIEQNMEAGEKLNRNISVREAAGNGNEFEADSEKTLLSTNKPRGFMEFESQSNRKHEGDLRTEKGPGNLKILNEKEKHFQPDEPKEWEMEFADDVITGNMDSNTREHQNNEERRINSRSLGVPTVMDRPIHEQCDDFENKFGGVFSKEISAVKVESQLDLVESISGQEVDDLKQQQTENSLSERISTEMHDTESKHLGDEKLEVSGKKVIETLCNVKMLETELLDVSEDTGSQKPCVILMECKTEPEHRELIVAFRNKDASILDTETDDSYEKNPDVLGSNRKNVSKLSSAKSNPRCEKFLESAEKDASNLSEAETDSGYERYFGVLGLSKIKKTSVAKLSGNIEKQVKEAQGKKERDSSQTSDIRDKRLGENHSSITHKMEISSSKVRSNSDSVINNSIFIKTTNDGEELSKETDELGDEKQQNESARIEAEEKISEARSSRRRKMARKRSVRFEGNDYVYYGKRISLENCQDNDTSDLVMKTSSLSGILEKSSSELGKEKDQTNCSERFAKQDAVSLRSIHTRGTNRNGLQRNIPVNDDNPAIIRTPENVKKRGRKAKVKNSNDGASTTTASRQASYIAESPPTGPKDGASNAETPEDQTVAGNIGRRSRKRKIDHCENTTDDRQTSNKITSGKKRGRKKKLVESSSNEQATTKEGDKSLVLCLRCKEHFEFPSALKYHMMRAHQALWTDDCPEGKTDKEALRTIIKRVGKLYCPLCGKELRFLAYYIFHIEWCGREDEVEICSVCNKEIKCMYAVMHARAHAKQIRDEETRKNQVGVGLSAEEGTSQIGLSSKRRKAAQKALDTLSEVTHSLLNIDEGRQSRRPSKPKSPTIEFSTDEGDEETDSDSDLGSCHDISGDGKYGGNNEVRSYRDYVKGFQMFFNFRKEQESKGALFENIFPKMHSFARLELGEAENYLPKARKSPFFTARKEKSLISLPLFHVNSSSDNNNFNIFVGGPIWSAAWCPVPCTSKTGQYMAIYCHREMKEMHQTAESFKQESLIQIWDCGPLSSTSTNEQKPFFAFGIAHDYGCVYDMSWCPARAYQVSQQPQQDVTASRQIGLLAAACSDGTVRIFSIPYPGDLIKENKERPILYRIQPSATLHHQNDNSGCCLCVDWGHGSDHRFILGGYPAGIVKLWDLKTKSPLLFTTGSDGLVVYPCSSFQCHLQDVTSCRWSMSMPDYFATCSVDRCVKIWNMNDVTHPVCHEYYSRCNAVQWTHCWSGVFLSQDDCYCLEHCCVYYQDCASGGTDTKRPILWHNTAIWDLSYSNWLNVVVSCDNQGLVNMYCCPVLTKIGLTKRTSTRRKTLFTSHVKDREDCTPDNWGETSKSPNDASTVVTPVGENENSLLNNDVIVVQDSNDSQNLDSSMIQSYEDMMQRYCLQYDDRRQNSTLEGKAATLPKDMTKDFPQNFPVRAIYKIQMNPNFQSCTWLLTGGQAGIVRLINVSELLHKNAVQQVEPN